MRQEGFELLGGLLRAGERTDCSGQALEAEGFELLRGALFYPWQGLVAGLKRVSHMGCMMPFVEGTRENRLQRAELPDRKGHPRKVVATHPIPESRKENRLQLRASLALLGGALSCKHICLLPKACR